MPHAVANPFNACWRSDSEEGSKTKSSAENNRLILHPDCDTLIGSAELVNPVHVNYEKEWQNTLDDLAFFLLVTLIDSLH